MFIFLLIVFFGTWSSCSFFLPSSKEKPSRPDQARDLLVALIVTFICFLLFY